MHENVFGYVQSQPNHPVVRRPFKLQTGLYTQALPDSIVSVEATQLNEGTLPSVVLEEVPMSMRVNEDQESARLLMETRVI